MPVKALISNLHFFLRIKTLGMLLLIQMNKTSIVRLKVIHLHYSGAELKINIVDYWWVIRHDTRCFTVFRTHEEITDSRLWQISLCISWVNIFSCAKCRWWWSIKCSFQWNESPTPEKQSHNPPSTKLSPDDVNGQNNHASIFTSGFVAHVASVSTGSRCLILCTCDSGSDWNTWI